MEDAKKAGLKKEKKTFTISEVLEGINQKMVRRHPHVFGFKQIKSPGKVLDDWNRQKKIEKARESVLDGMVKSSPALHTAFQIGSRVASHGFDWRKPLGALKKTKEEISELERALESGKKDEIYQEIGDILFSMANVSRHLGINPEIALKHANEKFIKRFQYIEEQLKKRGKALKQTSLEEMDDIWNKAKKKIR